jgi:hypothetical protein|tara:strand:- start:295 stop:537 length:243 start_codon:yes stop_codon:yes gene_type:complete
MEKESKVYIENSKFMKFIDELATRITEERFGEETFESKDSTDTTFGFTDEAQDFYNKVYDEYETLTNNILGLYCSNEFNK